MTLLQELRMVPGRLLRYKIHPVKDPDPVPVANKEEVSQNPGVSGLFRLNPYTYNFFTKQNFAKSLNRHESKVKSR
jgi:hypothetical protein